MIAARSAGKHPAVQPRALRFGKAYEGGMRMLRSGGGMRMLRSGGASVEAAAAEGG